jgi:hypothetical protein
MSKKLIAVAAAAALALTGLVSAPASATSVSFTVVDFAGSGTSTAPYTHSAPLANELLNDGTIDGAATNTAVRYVVTAVANTTVSITSTGGVKLLDAQTNSTNKYDTTSGSTSLSLPTGSGTTVTFWAFSTSITPGTVVITDRGNVSTSFVAMSKTSANLKPYNVKVSAPAAATAGTQATLAATVTDVFGNVIDSTNAGSFARATDLDVVIIGGGTLADSGNWTYSTTRKVWEAKVNLPTTGGTQAIGVTLQDANAAISSLVAAGFAAPVTGGFVTINAQDQSALITTLQGQVAALTAQLAASVSKAKYNKLAKRWNRANPSNKVKLAK